MKITAPVRTAHPWGLRCPCGRVVGRLVRRGPRLVCVKCLVRDLPPPVMGRVRAAAEMWGERV